LWLGTSGINCLLGSNGFQYLGLLVRQLQFCSTEHGVSFSFVHPCSEVQQRHPQFTESLQLVKDLLSKTVGAELAKALLDREIPGQVHFANPM